MGKGPGHSLKHKEYQALLEPMQEELVGVTRWASARRAVTK